MTAVSPTSLERLVAGDLAPLAAVAAASHQEVLEAWQGSTRPTLTRTALIAVLEGLGDGDVSDEDAVRWATLMRHGYLETVGPTLPAVEIELDEPYADAIIRALSYLEDVTDVRLSGVVDPIYIGQLIAALRYRPNVH